ncbi:MAG: hypothetical protein RQ748_07305 [Elusimicrobiales bacterium]|nr:hypothetical protein [Elusimicrobiales bacterium]
MRDKLIHFARRAGRGQMAIMLVLVTLLFLLIMIPVIEMFVRNESIWTVKERKNTVAFHLAEAGIDRAYWKLIEKEDNFKDITEGAAIPGYADDVEYTDVKGGSYKINMTVGDTNLKVQVIATGKDATSKEYRAIKAVFAKQGVTAALQAGSVGASGNATIHWGPMMSLSGMVLKGAANELYPRKLARGSITSNAGYADRDNNPNAPNKGPHLSGDHIEWWSYNESPGVPDILTPDTSYYASLAQEQETATGLNLYVNGNYSENNLVDTVCDVGAERKVRFITGNAAFGGSKYFCGVLIVLGDLTFSGNSSNAGKVSVTPPAEAWREYLCNVPTHSGAADPGAMTTWTYEPDGSHPATCDGPHGDTAAVDEYPGDAGYKVVSPCYHFYEGRDDNCDGIYNDSGHIGLGSNATQGREPLSFQGYIYVAGDFDKGSDRIFGAVHAAGTGGITGGGDIFYDENINVRFLNNNIARVSWHEVAPTEF